MSAKGLPTRTAVGAVVWGFAEATVFFVVPDVIITLVGLRSARRATIASLWAALGAAVGGAVMWWFGANHTEAVFEVIELVPAVSTEMVHSVVEQTEEMGLWAVLTGQSRATPFKIYAAEWGASGGSLLPFFLARFPARLPRFLLAGWIARGVERLATTRWGATPRTVRRILVAAWVVFYAVYWLTRPW